MHRLLVGSAVAAKTSSRASATASSSSAIGGPSSRRPGRRSVPPAFATRGDPSGSAAAASRLRCGPGRRPPCVGRAGGRPVISVEQEVETTHTTRRAVVHTDDPLPRRPAIAHDRLETIGDEEQAVVSPDAAEVAYVFRPRGDLSRAEIRVRRTVAVNAARRATTGAGA
jgi:hypothetical protein